jgi:hypothetical protein
MPSLPQDEWPSELIYRAGDQIIVYRLSATHYPAQVKRSDIRNAVVEKARYVELEIFDLEATEYYGEDDEPDQHAAIDAVMQSVIADLLHVGVEII